MNVTQVYLVSCNVYFSFRLDDAAKALKEEMDCYSKISNEGLIYKLVMALVVVHLHRDDYIAADQLFQQALRLLLCSLNLATGTYNK